MTTQDPDPAGSWARAREATGRSAGGADARGAAEPPGREWFEGEVVELLPELYGAALRMAKNEPDAEDLVAEAVCRAWEKRETLADPDRFRGWIFRILTNCFLTRCRHRDAVGETVSLDEERDRPSEETPLFERLHRPFLLWWGNPERRFLDRLLREDLERAVDGLPEPYRVAVILADVQGFSYAEIAEAMDVPIGTVRSRLSRGRSLLQDRLWSHAVDRGWRSPAEAENG